MPPAETLSLSMNAWTGTATPSGIITPSSLLWGLKRQSGGPSKNELTNLAPKEIEDWDWKNEEVGWGLVLPDNDLLTKAARATADDAPPAIQRLFQARQPAPVLRYRKDGDGGSLHRYYANGGDKPFQLVGSTPGVGDANLPRYLLLYGGPDAIPWSFQYSANLSHYVGRLSLTGTPLDRYVDALISDWSGMASDPRSPVVWSVSHGHPDITWLMDAAISKKMVESFKSDADLTRVKSLVDNDATVSKLLDALEAGSPSVVVTTSHGMTGPLDDAQKLVAQLGLLVDVNRALLQPDAVLARWAPNGAIWYSHACCSAGSDAPSCYVNLLDPGSDVVAVLKGVAVASGQRVAPFPEQLLGAERPLRAFVGHVEPTFDVTLREPKTQQPLTHTIRNALYTRLFSQSKRAPVGWAMERVFDDAGAMLSLWAQAVTQSNNGKVQMRAVALYRQLTALDRQHTVILGDPTVALPPLSSTPA